MGMANNKQNKRSNALVLAEAVIIAYVSYMASFLVSNLFDVAPPQDSVLVANIVLLTFFALICSLAVGLYEAKLRETFRGIIRRIFVSIAITYFSVEIINKHHIPGTQDGNLLPADGCRINYSVIGAVQIFH